MQILIDISDIDYNDTKEYGTILDECRDDIAKAIINGIPLTEVLEDIKADIEGLKHEHTDVSGYRWWDNAIDNALSIITEHCRRADSEVSDADSD